MQITVTVDHEDMALALEALRRRAGRTTSHANTYEGNVKPEETARHRRRAEQMVEAHDRLVAALPHDAIANT